MTLGLDLEQSPSVHGVHSCPFCRRIADGETTAASSLAVAFLDAYPVSPGHTLVVPRRHEAEFFELTADEQRAIWDLVVAIRAQLARQHATAAFNVGVNCGHSAGQTVAHAHVHLIPRFPGDVVDPRGGVRMVIPGRARYWSDP